MPEYLSNKKRKQSIGINSYSEYTDTTKIIGNVLVGFGSVGVGTTVPTQDVDVNTIRVRDTLYDYTNSGGVFGYYLVKDTDGIKWVAVPPIDSNAIFVAENNNILGVSSFTGLNIISDELIGVAPNPINPNFADITIVPRWLKSGETGIYTTKNVGIGTTIPTTDFQVGFGTTGVTIDGSVGVVSALGYYGNYAFIDQITVNDQLNVVGLGSTLVAAYLASAGGITTTGGDLYVGGSLFADKLDIINLKVVNIEATGITTLNVGIVSTFRVTGVSTLGVTSTKDLFVDANLEVSGVTTLGITSTKDLFVDENLYVVGIATATRFSTGVTGSAINITSNTISGPAEIIIDPADVSDNSGAVRIKGDLYVDGEEFIVNSTTIELADFNVGIASTVGTNFLLDGAGIGIGSTNIRKTLTYDFSSDALKSSENFDLETGKVYKINETEVLSSTLLTVANINATGVSTIGTLEVTGVSTFVGVGTFIDDLYVGEVLYADIVVGLTSTTDLLVDGDLRVTGISTFVGFSTFNNSVVIEDNLLVSGLSTFVGVGTFIDDLYVGEVLYANIVTGLTSTTDLLVDGDLRVTGVSTFVGFSTFNNSVIIQDNLLVSGITTLAENGGITTTGGDLYVGGILYADTVSFDSIQVENINATGITTLNVGIVSSLTVTGLSTLGVTSTTDLLVDGNLEVTGVSTFVGVGTFSGDLYVGGDLYVTDDLVFDEFTARNANITGIGTIETLDTTTGTIDFLTNTNLDTSGIGTIETLDTTTGTIDFLTNTNLDTSGIGTIETLDTTTGTIDYLTGTNLSYSGIGTIETLDTTTGTIDFLSGTNLSYSGISTLGVTSTTDLTSQQLNVSGITTLGITSTTNLTTQQLNVSAITTLGVTTISQIYVSGVSTFVGAITGTISTATKLEMQRTFEITGDVVASPIFFDGTGNVSLAATIQPNSVGLGTDTFGDYVKNITGTLGEITVTTGTGEGSSPIISFVPNPTIGGNVTIGNDLQVNNNLNVTGNITVGGTASTLFASDLFVFDRNIVLGIGSTNISNNDITTDNTANGGGIAIASTEGNPLVSFDSIGVNTYSVNYKQIAWFKTGTFVGLGTDAWLSNYALGVGTTELQAGTILAAGSVQFSKDDLNIVRNINASGIITATEFKGTLTGYASSAGITTHIRGGAAGNVVYQSAPDTTTFVNNSSAINGQVLLWNGATPYWGYVDAGSVAGIVTYADRAGIAANVIGGIASVTSLNVTGITTLGTIEISSGIVTAKAGTGIVTYYGDGSKLSGVSAFSVQQQDITSSPVYPTFASNIGTSSLGIAATELVYIPASGNLGIGTTSPTSKLTVVGDVLISGVLTATRFYSGIYGEFVGGSISGSDIVGTSLSITGISTIANFIMTPVGTGATVGGIGVTYYGDGSQLTNVVSTSGYADTAGVSTTSGYATNAGIATYADTAGVSTISGYATNAGIATYADTAGVSTTSGYATNAGVSTTSNYATSAGIATYADTAGVSTTSGYATNAGIATYADTAGVSTTSGYATNAGIATYADTAGVSTTSGYSTSAGIATYADTAGVSTTSNYATNAGVSTTSGYSTSAGIATYADTAGVSTTSNYATNAGVSTTSGYSTSAGIATYADTSGISTIATNVIGGIASVTSLNVSGITTLGTVEISSGIITAVSGYAVTYYGDGSQLSGVSAFSVQQQDIITSPVYPTFASNIGTSSLGIAVTQVAYIPASGNLGIGTTTPTSKLTVIGDVLVSGVLTATRLYSGIYGEFVGGSISGSDIVGTSLSITGISTLGTVKISSGIITSTTGIVTYYGDGSNLTNVVGAFGGIGTAGGTVGTGITFLDFRGSGISSITVSSGIATITIPGASRSGITSTAAEGDTSFAATYSVGYADVYLNGSKLSDTEYIATNGTSIELTEPASAGDIVEIVSYLINITGGSSTPDISPVMMGMIF
jgi:hypothetical protein